MAQARTEPAGRYIAKGGDWTPAEEMTRGDLKTSRTGGRTPFQILADYCQTGDTRDRGLWHVRTAGAGRPELN